MCIQVDPSQSISRYTYHRICTQWHSQVTDNAQALHAFVFFPGWGHAPLVKFCILEVATQIVLETIFEMPSVLNWD